MFAERVTHVSPFLAVEMYGKSLAMERAGKSVIHLEIGEPDFATPRVVGDALQDALNGGYTHYTDAIGDFDLRESIATYYKSQYGVTVEPDRVLCFPGSSPALLTMMLSLLNSGDEVIMSDPCYPCYASNVRFTGGVPVFISTHEADGFRLQPDAVRSKISSHTKAMVINSPCNPTGVLMEPERMQALADLGVLIISDEIYHGLNYSNDRDHSILEYTDNAIVMNGFSKLYAMTGWRLGYLIVPHSMVRTMRTLMQHFFISAVSLVQRAGITALQQTAKEVEEMRQEYGKRRLLILKGLRELGFGIKVEPLGAFYVLANARHLGRDSLQLAYDILDEVGVVATPGVDFGRQSEGFLRFSYANSVENITEALRRLKTYAEKYA